MHFECCFTYEMLTWLDYKNQPISFLFKLIISFNFYNTMKYATNETGKKKKHRMSYIPAGKIEHR